MPPMLTSPVIFFLGVAVFLIVAWDAFEAIILPRRVTRGFRLTRIFYKSTWVLWRGVVCLQKNRRVKDTLLGFYGPISLLILVAIWAAGLVFSFGMMQYGAGSALNAVIVDKHSSFWTDLYLSGTTFFTLGLGDVLPRSSVARALVVIEAGFGFGFLAAVIGYLPFIYGSFSKREVNISLLDARAGTPPSAGELLRRHSDAHGLEYLRELLSDWEIWSAELMESHLSYPVLAYFRSQHDNQSWLASLTAILDTCAFVLVGIDGVCERQAELTFAIARHAIVDLSQVFKTPPRPLPFDRLPDKDLRCIRDTLAGHGVKLHDGEDADRRLRELRSMYEPYVYAMAEYLGHTLPPWIPRKQGRDNWQTTAWERRSGAGNSQEEHAAAVDDHF